MLKSAIISVGIMAALTSFANAGPIKPVNSGDSLLSICQMTSDSVNYNRTNVDACCSETLGVCSVCTKSSPKKCWQFPTALRGNINKINAQSGQVIAPISKPPRKTRFRGKMFPKRFQGKVTRR